MSKKLARRTSRCDTKRVVGCVSLLEYSEISRGVSRGTDHVVFHSSCRLPQACIFVSKFFPPDFFKGSLFFFPPGFDSHTRPPCRAWWLAPRGSNPSIHACHLSSALASASPMKFFLGSSLFFTLLKKKNHTSREKVMWAWLPSHRAPLGSDLQLWMSITPGP